MMVDEDNHRHIMGYADNEVREYEDTNVPTFLKWVYVILPIWGVIWWWLYWDGSTGALDRGKWQQLERAAQTTMKTQGQMVDARESGESK
jgi:hypothetical protein